MEGHEGPGRNQTVLTSRWGKEPRSGRWSEGVITVVRWRAEVRGQSTVTLPTRV